MTDVKDQALDAARIVFGETGVVSSRMGRIAEQAGVSRATLYRYFRTKDALVRAYAEREMMRSMHKLAKKIGRLPKLSDRLVEAIAFSVEVIRKEPAVTPFLAPDALGVAGSVAFRSDIMMDTMRVALKALLDDCDDSEQLRADVRLDELMEWMLRLILSLGLVEGERRKGKNLQAFIRRLVVPAFVE